VENLKRAGGFRERSACPRVRPSPGAPPSQPPRGRLRESAGGASPGSRARAVWGPLWRGPETHESIGSSWPRPVACTDLRGEQGPEAAGHRQLLVLRAGARDAGNGTSRSSPLAGFSLTKWCEEKGRPGGQPPGPLEERSRRSLHRDPLSLLRESRRPRLNTAVSHPAGPLTSGRIYPTGRHCHREKPRTGPGGKPQESRRVPRGILLPVRVPSPWSAAPPDSRSREGQSA
jgi:hypothetical protein